MTKWLTNVRVKERGGTLALHRRRLELLPAAAAEAVSPRRVAAPRASNELSKRRGAVVRSSALTFTCAVTLPPLTSLVLALSGPYVFELNLLRHFTNALSQG